MHRQRTSDEIREDIQETRESLDRDLQQIENKLSGSGLLREVLGEGSTSLGDVISRHPGPAALMGLGAAWLAIDSTKSDNSTFTKEKAKGMADDAKHKAKDAKNTIKEKVYRAGNSAKNSLDSAMNTTREKASKAKHKVQDSYESQPLAMGALAFGVGLASGLIAPRTRVEDESFGHISDTIKDETKRTLRAATTSAEAVAKETARATKQSAEEQGIVEDIKESAKTIAREAKKTADRHDLDAQGLKKRAKNAKTRTKKDI